MKDRFGRVITKLRISVTDRCNFRCQYCMSEKSVNWKDKKDILTLEEITDAVRIAASMGITHIRLTGGEPLLRQNLVALIKEIKTIPDIQEIAMTTNGILLPAFAQSLADAGLQRVNISVDTIDPKRFREVTQGGDLKQVFNGIDAAISAGLTPIKINCVVRESSSETEAQGVKAYAERKGIKAQFIRLMNLKTGIFSTVEGGEGGNCKICNRIRLLCDGTVRPCLFSDIGFNVRQYGAKQAFTLALAHKPEMGGSCLQHWMNQIGG